MRRRPPRSKDAPENSIMTGCPIPALWRWRETPIVVEIMRRLATILLTTLAVPNAPIFAADPSARVKTPTASSVLATLHRGHPRLLMTEGDFARLKRESSSDAQLKQWRADLLKAAERMLGETPSKYEIPDGLRLLATSRRVLDRVLTLGLAHHLTGEQRFAERAWTELDAAAQFKDWNPKHFLDVAEMTHAFAIG